MTALVGYIFSAGGIVLVLLAGAVWLWARPASHRARRWVAAAAFFYAMVSTFGVTYQASRLLAVGVRPFQASDVPSGTTAIVVLGSGAFTARDWDGNLFAVPDPSSANRVLEAFRVFRLIDAAWVITSGGLLDPTSSNEPTGRTNGNALLQLGVPQSQLIVDTTPRNTAEEAAVVTSRLRSLGISQVVLVTSGIHMRRSLGAFKAQGVDAIPAITRLPDNHLSWPDWVLPSSLGLSEGSLVAHEALGLAYYTARGWSRF